VYRSKSIEIHAFSGSIVSSLRDSYINLSQPGTPVPGYRLYRPCGTAGAEGTEGTAGTAGTAERVEQRGKTISSEPKP
jgi:hypothetical protein